MNIKNDPPAANSGVNHYLNSVSSTKKAEVVAKNGNENPGDKGIVPQDTVTLSQKAHDINRIKKAVNEFPDVREEKVNELKKAVENGTYNVNGKQVAEKMMQSSSALDIIT